MRGLHVREHGNAHGRHAVVLLHAGVADGRGWDAVAHRLAREDFRVLVPDLRGFGMSPDPSEDFRHVDDVLALLDEHGIDAPAVLVGWSMSGTIALELAVAHPERVSALALVCSVPEPLPRSAVVEEAWEREERLLDRGDFHGAIRNDIKTWGAGADREVADLAQPLVEYMTDVAEDLLARAERATGEALDGDAGAPSRIATFDRPLLVVTAEHDTPCHEDAARTRLASAPRGRHAHVAGAAHMAPMERPDAVADALIDFLLHG